MCDVTLGGLESDEVAASKTCTEKEEEPYTDDASINLLDMPLEIFLKICSYLDADFISTLSKVCCRFEDILCDGALWRCWVSRRLRYPYPALRELRAWHDKELNWEDACIDIDRETRRWRNVEKTMRHIIIEDVHYATIDSVLLINNAELCASGGRDRALALWSLSDVRDCSSCEGDQQECSAQPLRMISDAHRGWVWDITVDSPTAAKTVYSGSWDNTVKSWDLATNLGEKDTFQCKMSVLAVAAKADLLMAGLYSRLVLIFDTRAGENPITSYKQHKGPVLKLQMHGDLITSLSEDRTIAVFDQRAGKVLASNIKCTENGSYPVCLSWTSAAMYVGDSTGSIHLIDPEQFVHLRSYELWPEPEAAVACDKVTGIQQSLGSFIVASDKGEFKCLYPSDPVQEYASFRSKAKMVTRLHYQNDNLLIGTCDSSLEFWIPAENFSPSEPL